MRKRLKAKKGFSLTEMLATVLIMSLVVASSVTGITAISSTYRKVLRQSNAEHLMTAVNTAMTGELSFAKYVNEGITPVTNEVTFYSATYRTCKYGVKDGKLIINSTKLGEKQIINDSTYPDGLAIKELKVNYDDSTNKFTVEIKIGDAGVENILTNKFVVKCINP